MLRLLFTAVVVAACGACPQTGARACSTNADCEVDQLCVVVDGSGTCGKPADPDPEPEPDAGVAADAGNPDDDAGTPADAGPDPDDAGVADAGGGGTALTSGPAVGASTSTNGALRLRARLRAAEVPAPLSGGTLELSPPRR